MGLRKDKIVIDVSKWQGTIDWSSVKETPGLVGAIIRAGYSTARDSIEIDPKFERNYNECKKHGIPVGTYLYLNKTTKNIPTAIIQMENKALSGRSWELPIYLDVEEKQSAIQTFTQKIDAACDYLERCKYFVGVYGSDINTFRDMVDGKYLVARYTSWVARYGKEPTFISNYDLWQYTDTGEVKGISGNVDISYCTDAFLEKMEAIKKRRFNNL